MSPQPPFVLWCESIPAFTGKRQNTISGTVWPKTLPGHSLEFWGWPREQPTLQATTSHSDACWRDVVRRCPGRMDVSRAREQHQVIWTIGDYRIISSLPLIGLPLKLDGHVRPLVCSHDTCDPEDH